MASRNKSVNSRAAKMLEKKRKEQLTKTIDIVSSPTSEVAVIAGVLGQFSVKRFSQCIERGVSVKDFFNEPRAELWARCLEIYSEQGAITPQALKLSIETSPPRNPKLRDATFAALENATEHIAVMDTETWNVSLDALCETRIKRNLQWMSLGMLHEIQHQAIGVVQSNLGQMVEDAQNATRLRAKRPEDLCKIIEREQEEIANAVDPPSWPINIPDLDELLDDGFQRGRLYYIGGPEKAGKTMITSYMVGQMLLSKRGARCSWFSVEMSESDTLKALAVHSRSDKITTSGRQISNSVTLNEMKKMKVLGGRRKRFDRALAKHNSVRRQQGLGPMSLDDFIKDNLTRAWAEGLAMMNNRGLEIMTLDGETIEDISAMVRGRQAAESDDDRPLIVVVDYVQDIETSKRVFNEADRIRRVSRQLRRLAKVEKCIVIGLFHTKRGSGAPSSDSVFGSSQLSKDADHMMLLWRPFHDDRERWKYTQVIVDRSRHGRTGTVDVVADLSHVWFDQWEVMKHGEVPKIEENSNNGGRS